MAKSTSPAVPQSHIYGNETYDVFDGQTVIGDAESLIKTDVGGNDLFCGADSASSYAAFGDGYSMTDSSRGGNDVFHAGASSGAGGTLSLTSGAGALDSFDGGVLFVGDAEVVGGTAKGGGDYFDSGDNSGVVFFGDAIFFVDSARGGRDTLNGSDAISSYEAGAANNTLIGDAFGFEGVNNTAAGGNDSIYGGDASSTDGYGAAVENTLLGDAYEMTGHGLGGADYLEGGDGYSIFANAMAVNSMAGDAWFMSDYAVGGADTLVGGDGFFALQLNTIAGDAMQMSGQAAGGNDVMWGGNGSFGAFVINLMAGDAFSIDGAVKFGADRMTGGNGDDAGTVINTLYGDTQSGGSLNSLLAGFSFSDEVWQAITELDFANSGVHNGKLVFGNDTLTGGSGSAEPLVNALIGDAGTLVNGDIGGNDVLRGGGWGTFNTLIGDAEDMLFGSIGGKDTLISGDGSDDMMGDAFDDMFGVGGADKFVFGRYNGTDTIEDFRRTDGDKIDLTAFAGLADFKSFKTLAASGRMEDVGNGVLIHLDPNYGYSTDNTVLVVGVGLADLTSVCFIF